jgi:hypothetical protein
LSAFCLTVEVSSSIDDAVSSSELACCSVRLDKSRLPAAIWLDAVAIMSVPLRTSETISTRPSFIFCSALSSWPISSFDSILICSVRLPAATLLATRNACASEREIPLISQAPIARPATRPTAIKPMATSFAVWKRATAASYSLLPTSSCNLISAFMFSCTAKYPVLNPPWTSATAAGMSLARNAAKVGLIPSSTDFLRLSIKVCASSFSCGVRKVAMYSPHFALMAWLRCSACSIAAGSCSGWPLAAVARVFWFC